MATRRAEPAPLVAIEGLDGAGKFTLTSALETAYQRRGLSVGRLAFPRYGHVHADLAAAALHDDIDHLVHTPYTMAMLFALDRYDALGDLARLRAEHDVVVLDRYIASNAAYTMARVGSDNAEDALKWVTDVECARLGLPEPALQVYLEVPVELAAERASERAHGDPDRPRDTYERDGDLQTSVARAYHRLADRAWMSPWRICRGDRDISTMVDELIGLVM